MRTTLQSCLLAADKSKLMHMHDAVASLEAVTALMNEGVERLCDALARIGAQGGDVNIWRQFGAPLNAASPMTP